MFSKELEEEITERLDISEGELDRNTYLRWLIEDMDDSNTIAYRFRAELREYAISIGIYREVSKVELDNTVTLGGRKYEFKLRGKYYVFNSWKGLGYHI